MLLTGTYEAEEGSRTVEKQNERKGHISHAFLALFTLYLYNLYSHVYILHA